MKKALTTAIFLAGITSATFAQKSCTDFFKSIVGKNAQNEISLAMMGGCINTPEDIIPVLTKNGLTIGQDGMIVEITDKDTLDFNRPEMFKLLGMKEDSLVILPFVKVNNGNFRDSTAWTLRVGGQELIIVKHPGGAISHEWLGTALGNEFLHTSTDFKFTSANQLEQFFSLGLSDQLKMTAGVYKDAGMDMNDPRILKFFSNYVEQFLSRGLSMLDIKDKTVYRGELAIIAENIIKNFSPDVQYQNDYLIESSIALSLLKKQYPDKEKYASENAYVHYITETYRNSGKYKTRPEVFNAESGILMADLEGISMDLLLEVLKNADSTILNLFKY